MRPWLATALLLTAACGSPAGTAADSSTTSVPSPGLLTAGSPATTCSGGVTLSFAWSGGSGTDTDGDGLADQDCDGQLDIDLLVPCPPSTWRVGLVAPDLDWTGEDCLTDERCHRFDEGQLQLSTACEALPVLGQTTRFGPRNEAQLVYVIHDDTDCFTQGLGDHGYYEALGCTVMAR